MKSRALLLTAALLVPTMARAEVREVVLSGHTFVVDSQNHVLYGWGVAPTTPTIPDGTPVSIGTPFWDTSTSALVYWNGAAWAAPTSDSPALTTPTITSPTITGTVTNTGGLTLSDGLTVPEISGANTIAFVDETALDLVKIDITTTEAALGKLLYGAVAATSTEATTGVATFACNNIADTEACTIDIIQESPINSVGTLTCVPTIDTDETNAVMVVLTCDEEAGDNGGTVYWRLDMLTTNTTTAQSAP